MERVCWEHVAVGIDSWDRAGGNWACEQYTQITLSLEEASVSNNVSQRLATSARISPPLPPVYYQVLLQMAVQQTPCSEQRPTAISLLGYLQRSGLSSESLVGVAQSQRCCYRDLSWTRSTALILQFRYHNHGEACLRLSRTGPRLCNQESHMRKRWKSQKSRVMFLVRAISVILVHKLVLSMEAHQGEV